MRANPMDAELPLAPTLGDTGRPPARVFYYGELDVFNFSPVLLLGVRVFAKSNPKTHCRLPF